MKRANIDKVKKSFISEISPPKVRLRRMSFVVKSFSVGEDRMTTNSMNISNKTNKSPKSKIGVISFIRVIRGKVFFGILGLNN